MTSIHQYKYGITVIYQHTITYQQWCTCQSESWVPPGWTQGFWWRKGLSSLLLAFTVRIPSFILKTMAMAISSSFIVYSENVAAISYKSLATWSTSLSNSAFPLGVTVLKSHIFTVRFTQRIFSTFPCISYIKPIIKYLGTILNFLHAPGRKLWMNGPMMTDFNWEPWASPAPNIPSLNPTLLGKLTPIESIFPWFYAKYDKYGWWTVFNGFLAPGYLTHSANGNWAVKLDHINNSLLPDMHISSKWMPFDLICRNIFSCKCLLVLSSKHLY